MVYYTSYNHQKMWMAYVESVEVFDLYSGVRSLRAQFSNLQFDAYHEAIYGMSRFMPMDECNDLGDRYRNAKDSCDDYLDGKISLYKLANNLQVQDLVSFLNQIRQYLPRDLYEFYCKPDSDTEEKEDDNDSDTEESNSQKEVVLSQDVVEGNVLSQDVVEGDVLSQDVIEGNLLSQEFNL